MSATLPTPDPRLDPELAPYWDATARGELLLARCRTCGVIAWPPRDRCPACMSADREDLVASGDGVVHTFTVNRRAAPPYSDVDALVIAYVDLPEGPRVLTNLVTDDLDGVRIGAPVRAVFATSPSGAGVLRFRLV